MSEILELFEVIKRLMEKDNILILCHKNPDGDTLGSASALCHALKSLGKKAAVLCNDSIHSRYNYMGIELFDNQFEPEYIVAVDVAGLQLFGDAVIEYAEKCDLCIDHHPSNSNYSDALYLDGDAAATAEIMYDIITALEVEITPLIADCLYTGIATDTGCFKFANVRANTHIVAAKLMELGTDYVELNSLLFENKSRSRLAIEKTALESLEYHFDDKCAMIFLTRAQIEDSGVDITDLEGITSLPRMIEGIKVGITLRQQPTGSYKVSVRTDKDIDACAICARLGGGGHRQASGCEIIGGLSNAKSALLTEVERELKKLVQDN